MKKLILILLFLPLLYGFDVYVNETNLTVGKPFTLIINASDFSGKVKADIDFGNFKIKWDCVYLDHEVIRYNIVPSTTKGTVYFEFEDGKKIKKIFKINPNPNYKPSVFSITYVQEKNCVFKPKFNSGNNNFFNSQSNIQNQQEEKKEEIIRKTNNYIWLFLIVIVVLLVSLAIAWYFYKIGRKEAEIIQELKENSEIPKLKKEILDIIKEQDYKKKAYKLYKLINEDKSLKNRIDEKDTHKLYILSFKKELNEEEKNFIDSIIEMLKR